MKKIGVFFTEGFEEIEGLTQVDILRRADIPVEMISVNGSKMVTGSHNIKVEMDSLFEQVDFEEFDGIVIPGGPGTNNMLEHQEVAEIVKEFHEKGKLVSAICAAPKVLAKAGVLAGKRATVYPGNEEIIQGQGAEFTKGEVVVDESVITSRAMGTSIPFALSLVRYLKGEEEAEKIRKSIVFQEEGC